jgi:hypothetical protein
LVFNGICGETGRGGIEPMESADLVRAILRQADPPNLGDLKLRRRQDAQSDEALARLHSLIEETERKLREAPISQHNAETVLALTDSLRRLERDLGQRQHLGVREDIDASKLEQAGWGAILADDADPRIIAALQPLFELRRAQAGKRFRLYQGSQGYRRNGRDTKSKFLVRSGATMAGPVSPEAVPYYLMIIGSPEQIPFDFQLQLDVQYAVGRLHFETVEEYARYAESVIAAEQKPSARPRQLTLFGVENQDDRATALSNRQLVAPLYDIFAESEPSWAVRRVPSQRAMKAELRSLLGEQAPALLFTASHGMQWRPGSAAQKLRQGALLCQDWPGPAEADAVIAEHYLSAADIEDSAQVHGMMLFLFACYSAGTPERDMFEWGGAAAERAPKPFISALPQRLLSHPGGGALAVIGHIDRAWSYSFDWDGEVSRVHTAAIESTLRRLLHGARIGYAMEYLNQRYAELATVLSDELGAVRNMRQPDEQALAELWTATHDARGYCVLGDPAVRLPAACDNNKEPICAF